MKQILGQSIFVLVVFLLLSIFKIGLSCEIADVFYTVAGILFSIEISQTLSFDFSKIANEKKYTQFTQGLESVRNSLLANFLLSTTAYAVLKVFDKNGFISAIEILKRKLDLKNFLCLWIISSIVFFSVNFSALFTKKRALDDAVRQEERENDK